MQALLLLLFCFPPAQAFRLVIDPGHGGYDSGTVHSGLKESNLVLKVAEKLKSELATDPDFEISLTRESDHQVALPARVHQAEVGSADLFVSLHANSEPQGTARGLEFFFQNSLPPGEEELLAAKEENAAAASEHELDSSKDLSRQGDVTAILKDLHRQARLRASLSFSQILAESWKDDEHPPSIKQAPLFVISRTSMPSVLVEIGFLTNQKDVSQLQKTAYQDDLAQRLALAIRQYRSRIASPSSAYFSRRSPNP